MGGRAGETVPMTLGELAADGLDLFCWCNSCGHNALIGAAVLVSRLGPGRAVPRVAARLRCEGCGSRDVAARPAWPSLGTVARHD